MRGNGSGLEGDGLGLDVGKKSFAVSVVRHWSEPPREVVDAPSFEVFGAGWGFERPCLVKDVPNYRGGAWNWMILEVSSTSFYDSVILELEFWCALINSQFPL